MVKHVNQAQFSISALYAVPYCNKVYIKQLNAKTHEFISQQIHLVRTDRFDIERGNGTLHKVDVSWQWMYLTNNGQPYEPDLVGPEEGFSW